MPTAQSSAVCTSCSAADESTSDYTLLHCSDHIDRWVSSNRLKLNAVHLAWFSTTAAKD